MASARKKLQTDAMESVVTLPPPDIQVLNVRVIGDSPLICHKFSDKCRKQIEDKQGQKAKTAKGARDPEQEFRDALYDLGNGKFGFPASAFKNAMISACRYVDGIAMTKVTGALFVMGDLIELKASKPRMRTDTVRIGKPPNKIASIAYRPEFETWSVELSIRFNARVLSKEQIINLLANAGFHVGVGDWRPERKGTFGMFRVEGRAA